MNHLPQRAIMGIKWDNTSEMLYTGAGAENVLRTGQPGTGRGSVGHRQGDEDGGHQRPEWRTGSLEERLLAKSSLRFHHPN